VANPIQGYFNSTTFTLDVNGFPIWNRAVGSTFMAKFAHTVLGNGAAAVTTGGFQVVKKTGMTVTVKPYFICKNGYMMYQTAETDITFTSSTSKQVFYIGARLDIANNHFYGDDVGAFTTFVSATDIASCKLTITANAVAITDGMIQDLRYNTTYCGQIDAYRERSLALLAELEQALEDTLAGGVPAHASTHAAGGADAITPASIGAAPSTHASRHASGGADAITPASIGAAALDANSKVTAAQASSAIVNISAASTTLSSNHAGKMLMTRNTDNATANYAFIVPASADSNIPIGTEIEILRYYVGTVTITAADGVVLYSIGGGTLPAQSVTIGNRWGIVSLKKVFAEYWIASGNVG
jgi:hypothetical protein